VAFVAAAIAHDAGHRVSFGEWTAYGGGLGGVLALTLKLLGL
jgi:Na+/H+ antiporter NhaD/arsenite permease-like protein